MTSGLQQKINEAEHIIFLTGAGVSTASGIPDYRSKNGIYNGQTLRPEYLLSLTAFLKEPLKQYQFMIDNMYFPDAQPNIIHEKMATLTQLNRAKIITQNVDDLHVKANTKISNLIRFHGSLYDIYSPTDNKKYKVDDYLKSPLDQENNYLRPKITFYEEMPFDIEKSVSWIKQSDLVIIVGTSFQVYPFAGLLNYVQQSVPVVAINLEFIQTPFKVEQIIGDAVDVFQSLKI